MNCENFNFESQNISLQSAFPVNMNFAFNSATPNIYGQVSLATKIKLNLSAQSFTVSPFVVNATLNGAQFPKNGLAINFETSVTLNKANATLDVTKLTGKVVERFIV